MQPDGVDFAEGIPGVGLPGMLDPKELEAIRAMRSRMRVLHHPISTESAFAFQLTQLESDDLKSQIVISKHGSGGRRFGS